MTLPAPSVSVLRDRSGRLIPPRSFVAIDFETGNPKRCSPIQIGLVRVVDGVAGSTQVSPVLPPFGHRWFAPNQTLVHGLRPGYNTGAPEWPEILERMVRFASPHGVLLPLVAHNASFEKSVINATSEATGVASPWGDLDYFCTVKYSRQVLPHLPKHKLDYLAEHLELPDFAHHDAGADAAVTAQILLRLAEQDITV